MNININELMHRWREGSLSEEQLRLLTAALGSKEGRSDLLAEWLLDAGLSEALQTAAVADLDETNGFPEMETMSSKLVAFRRVQRSWLPLAGAACAALLFSGWLVSHFQSARPRRDILPALASSQEALAQFSFEPPAPLPGWLSPTASILDQDIFPQ